MSLSAGLWDLHLLFVAVLLHIKQTDMGSEIERLSLIGYPCVLCSRDVVTECARGCAYSQECHGL